MFARFFQKKDDPVFPSGDEFRYCPSCGDEYRAEFLHCASCDVELVARPKTGSTSGTDRTTMREIVPGEDGLVDIRQGPLLDIKQVGRLLKEHGIASLLAGDGKDSAKGCCGSQTFLLKIRESDLNQAAAVLSTDFRRSTALDSHEYSVKETKVYDERVTTVDCPACGFSFLPEERTCPECGLCF